MANIQTCTKGVRKINCHQQQIFCISATSYYYNILKNQFLVCVLLLFWGIIPVYYNKMNLILSFSVTFSTNNVFITWYHITYKVVKYYLQSVFFLNYKSVCNLYGFYLIHLLIFVGCGKLYIICFWNKIFTGQQFKSKNLSLILLKQNVS